MPFCRDWLSANVSQGTFDEGLELKRCLDVLGKTLESVVDNYLYDVEVSLELAQPLETFPEHLTTFVRNYNLAFTGQKYKLVVYSAANLLLKDITKITRSNLLGVL